jgi:shikimate kinase
MIMISCQKGYGCAFGGATIVNAIASWKGSAFAVELKTYAEVCLDLPFSSKIIQGTVFGSPKTDTALIEYCVEAVFEQFDYAGTASVLTKSSLPIASGLKSSSAAANAVILAALDALGETMDPIDIVSLGVAAAKKAGVTITGAYDDACASFFGGVVLTDNRSLSLLQRDEFDYDVLILNPNVKVLSSQTNISRCILMKDLADIAFETALNGDYKKAMKLNGLVYCGALGFNPEPAISCMEIGQYFGIAAGLSGTGPSFAALLPRRHALTEPDQLILDNVKKTIQNNWLSQFPNSLILETKTCNRDALSESRSFSDFIKRKNQPLKDFDLNQFVTQ